MMHGQKNINLYLGVERKNCTSLKRKIFYAQVCKT